MKALLVGIFLFATALPASATEVTQFAWDRTGSEHLPCSGSVEWLLSPGTGIIDATVGINDDDGVPDGHAWGMLYAWTTETFYITTTEPVAVTDEVLVAFTGEAVTQPTLSLVGCTQAVTEPPPIPTTNPGPTPPTESPTTPTLVKWDIGLRVTTPRPTNVVVRSRVTCSNATDEVTVKRRLQTRTPIVRSLPASLVDATECHLRVVAFDIKPWDGPHGDGQTPRVRTWVILGAS